MINMTNISTININKFFIGNFIGCKDYNILIQEKFHFFR